MAISADVKNQLFRQSSSSDEEKLIRLPHESDDPASPSSSSSTSSSSSSEVSSNGKAWTREEHDRFLEGLELFPSGPWKEVAAYVGTRTTRQTMTHAQKYREKIARRKRGLRGSCSSQRATLQVRKDMLLQQPSSNAPASQTCPTAQHQQHLAKHVQASPTSVVLKAEQLQQEDPLDFDGCFMDLDYDHLDTTSPTTTTMTDLSWDPTLMVSLATSECDAQPLSLSDEEMDLIMDSVFPSSSMASYPSLSSSSSLQNAFSFVR
jgi:SHAQKYF class myb-like DNA-binding protein